MSARACAFCLAPLKRRANEGNHNWSLRLTCNSQCANARRADMIRARAIAADQAMSAEDGWPVIDRFFRWPDGMRFEDSPAALRDIGSRERLGLPPSRISGCGNAASMCIDRGEGYGRRIGRAA